jgi:hypothetical protein
MLAMVVNENAGCWLPAVFLRFSRACSLLQNMNNSGHFSIDRLSFVGRSPVIGH